MVSWGFLGNPIWKNHWSFISMFVSHVPWVSKTWGFWWVVHTRCIPGIAADFSLVVNIQLQKGSVVWSSKYIQSFSLKNQTSIDGFSPWRVQFNFPCLLKVNIGSFATESLDLLDLLDLLRNYGWLWMIMDDYGWLWMIMDDYGWDPSPTYHPLLESPFWTYVLGRFITCDQPHQSTAGALTRKLQKTVLD